MGIAALLTDLTFRVDKLNQRRHRISTRRRSSFVFHGGIVKDAKTGQID